MNEFRKQSNWYDKTWLVIILCVFIFPVGLYALWQNKTILKGWKIGITIVIALVVFTRISNDIKSSFTNADNSVVSKSETIQLTQFQIDSIAEVKLEERKTQTITAVKLTQDYVKNEVLADENYKDKYFYVEGRVAGINKGMSDEIYVTLNSSELLMKVSCYFDDKNAASQLEKGMKVTFYGRCDGFFLGVTMKDCSLVDNLEDLENAKK